MSDENTSRMVEFLKEHPRMMGVLFTVVLALTQAGTVAAGGVSSFSGP